MKQILDVTVRTNTRLSPDCSRLDVVRADGREFPELKPGQFAALGIREQIDGAWLRRPVSIHCLSEDRQTLSFVVKAVGRVSEALCRMTAGDGLSVVLPLGNGFPLEGMTGRRVLIVGGGVGLAPLPYYAARLRDAGAFPVILAGARSREELLIETLAVDGVPLECTTLDGSHGIKGVVTDSPLTDDGGFDVWVCCGPLPMMKAVARKAKLAGAECYVSLENKMACGLGACLCCVEKTAKGNVCTCTDGPVFNIKDLLW